MIRNLHATNSTGKQALLFIVTALLPSCSSADIERQPKSLSFRCPDGRTVMARFEPKDQFATVRLEGRELRLPHVISGFGARYSDGTTTFWNKGNTALVEIDDRIVVQDCVLE